MGFLKAVGIFLALTVLYLLYARLLVPYMEYRRLKAQGVVFNSRGFPLFNDMFALDELAKIDPHSGQALNLIKYTNNLEFYPPMYGLYLPVH